ncbi:hypothetical protein [Pseudoneobacillus rhizosphaerae]|uniref:Uncharacterized protein n=1 Tax=Pseudoneobacillus rhizosphaerae TaxID=2880968 RepID=A0A9C7G8T0_9BACI|nr:hypothetical protein [Pseudoneobacillus rhizosphaerae]CAG9607750.1 hypothetical protein NEOCIP111885_01442 [Pseudoneobacillus rhizosphaerae]
MMSLTSANMNVVVKRQYLFKLKANIDAFSSLIGIQVIALLFSLGGMGMSGSSSSYFTLTVRSYSADVVLAFTMIWGLVTAITITTRPYRNFDFTFVTNRLTSNLSNVLFLVTASLLGGVTSILSGYLVRVAGYFFLGHTLYSSEMAVGELIIGIIAASLYILTASSIGYLFGTLAQVSKAFIIVIPALLIGFLFLDISFNPMPIQQEIYQFYFIESSFILFLIKILLTTAILFGTSSILFNRMGVRQ